MALLSSITDYGAAVQPSFVSAYGGVGDGVTNNDTAINNVISDSVAGLNRVWLAQGNYLTTKAIGTWTDMRFDGPGKVLKSGSYFSNFRALDSNPGFNTDANNVYGQDKVQRFSDAEYAIIRTAADRLNPTPPRVSTALASAISAGATSATLASATGISVGNAVIIGGTSRDTVTVATVVGNVISWIGGIASAHPSGAPAYVAQTSRDYFGAQWIPHFKEFTVQAGVGYSGLTAHIPAGVSAGATSATLNSAAGLAVNDFIGFGPISDGPWTDIKQITSIAGNVISWTGGLANSYPLVPTYPLGPVVALGSRTFNSNDTSIYIAGAGGDHYIYGGRAIASYVPTAGQTHFFDTQTVGLFGGDVTLTSQGGYAQCSECSILDAGTGANGAIADVRSLFNNHAWGYGATWGGYFLRSAGSFACDFGLNVGGRFLRGLDMVLADFADGAQAAINLKSTQRIYFNSTTTTTNSPVLSRGEGYYGNVLGNCYMWHGQDVTAYWAVINGSAQITLRPSSLQINVPTDFGANTIASGSITSSGNINGVNITASSTISAANITASSTVSGTSITASGNITASGSITGLNVSATNTLSVASNKPVRFSGPAGNTYIIYDSGANVLALYKNGVQVATW